MALTEFEQFKSTQIIKEREYKRGVEAGYKKKSDELRIEREKEIEGTYSANEEALRQEELAQERDEEIRAEHSREEVMSPKDEEHYYQEQGRL